MADDVLLNKAASIERCLKRVDSLYRGHETDIETNFDRQDALILNLLRACETSIDAAMHLVRVRKLRLPQESREAFQMLEKDGVLSSELSGRMQRMAGFRNIAVHDYTKLDMRIVRSILDERLGDFRGFAQTPVRMA
jgi:uncharacterized protein YutE (UPF0331/DUF86 family)